MIDTQTTGPWTPDGDLSSVPDGARPAVVPGAPCNADESPTIVTLELRSGGWTSVYAEASSLPGQANDNHASPRTGHAVESASFFDRAMAAPCGMPSTNPKRAFGVKKPSAQFIPPVAIIEESVVMALGAAKYGAFNWQDDPVDATTYYSAAVRHLLQWFSGEDIDKESGASHLAHVRACMAILMDADASGTLIDDRPKCSSAGDAIERFKVAG